MKIINKLQFLFVSDPNPVADYSVRVSDLDRKQIMEGLVKYKGPVSNTGETERMRTTLRIRLKAKHPIHDKLKILTGTQLFVVCRGLSIDVPKRDKKKMTKLIVDHFFGQYPDAPLTNLQRILKEFITGEKYLFII